MLTIFIPRLLFLSYIDIYVETALWCAKMQQLRSVIMRFPLAAWLLLLAGSFATAQGNLCDAATPSTVGKDAGVIIQKVTLSGKWGSDAAVVYLPAQQPAAGAVVFSHSSIQADGASTDMHPFALTLARAGAVVIMPERSLLWPPADKLTNREGAVVFCAAHWLMDHAKLFNNGMPVVNENRTIVREGYAYVGPRVCDPALASDCRYTDPFDSPEQYRRVDVWVPVGETEGADSTVKIISDEGLYPARYIQQHLGLAPIKLMASISSSTGS
jgi:hypothetical protein